MMAVGFKLSSVLTIEEFPEDKVIRFTTKGIVYEIVFDDKEKRQLLIESLRKFKDVEKKAEDPKPRRKFYKEESEMPE